MKIALVVALAIPTAAQADVQLACIFDGLPPVLMSYPSDTDEKPTMQVGARPAAEMTVGQGAGRLESAEIDGYNFQFSPARINMQVMRDDAILHTGGGRCVTIGGPTNDAPLTLDFPTSTTQPKQEAASASQTPGKWVTKEDKSAFDDTRTVVLLLDADHQIQAQYGGEATPSLILRCMENTTAAYLTLGDYFLADIQGYGDVDFRVDDQKAQIARMSASTDNHALGLWSGTQAIPFIKQLAAGGRLALRVTPFNDSPKEVSFSLVGLSTVLPKLREACSW
jgi:type VI secretion system VasI family protein